MLQSPNITQNFIFFPKAKEVFYLCSYRRVHLVRDGRPAHEHLPTSRFRVIVDPMLVECLFSMALLLGGDEPGHPGAREERPAAVHPRRQLAAHRVQVKRCFHHAISVT